LYNATELIKTTTNENERVDSKQFFRLAENHYSLLGHEMRLSKERWRLDIRKYFFLSQTL